MIGGVARERVAKALEEVLARGEFQGDHSLLGDHVGNLFSGFGEGLAETSEVMVRLFPVLLVLLFAYLLFRAKREGRAVVAPGRSGSSAPGMRERVSRLVSEARSARAAGDLRRSLRLFCSALVVGLGASGDVSYREAWTNRELLRRGQPKAAARRLLEELVRELEGKEYGREEITAADLEHLEELCAVHLEGVGGRA